MSEHLSQIQLSGYSGRTLDPRELLVVDEHLASCDACHERLTLLHDSFKSSALPFQSPEMPFHLDYDQHLEAYVDGTANEIDREIVDSHVALCSKCAGELEDLLAFKQQPAAVAAGHSRVKSSTWKQWLPQWPLSNPAFATTVVIAVFVVAMAVLLWTMYPTSRGAEQAGTGSPNEQPSPAATERTTENNPPSNQSQENPAGQPPGKEPLVGLNDAGGEISVNQRGELDGLDGLPPDLKERVGRALVTRRLDASPALTGWTTGSGMLRGQPENQNTLVPFKPTDVVLETDRPAFRWSPLEGANNYTVTIFDSKLRLVESSGPITGTEWTTSKPLERGVTYSWQISALKDGKTIVSPKPPLPEARFRILDQRAVTALAKLKGSFGSSHLAMGVFYWKHGLIDEAEREFQALVKANPKSAVAAELLKSLRSSHHR